ncbi:MAG: hypothetical protein HS111_29285 [Kofleriaceae bacterium]|nr:hypothetical protein [Kofleriaceae bacterium]
MGGAPDQPRPASVGLNQSCMHWVWVVTTCSAMSLNGRWASMTSLARQVREGRDRRAQHDHVEVLAVLEHQRRPAIDPVRVHQSSRSQPLASSWSPSTSWSSERRRRPARQALDVDQRPVALAAGDLDLAADVDLRHPVLPGASSRRSTRWKKWKRTGAAAQHLVERREDRVAHPRLHLTQKMLPL